MVSDRYRLRLPYIDLHVAGEPFRLITECPAAFDGETMFENKQVAEEKIGYIRRLLMNKPRGYQGMYGGVLLEPTDKECDYGVLFMHCGGYSNMCGHGALAVARALYELYPEKCQKKEGISIDAPVGKIQLFCNVQEGKLSGVSLINRPSFVCERNKELTIPGVGIIHLDIVFAGGYMVYVSTEETGVTICREQIPRMLELSERIIPEIFDQVELVHPEMEELTLRKCGFCLIFADTAEEKDGALVSRNFTVYGSGLFDYSPTGTGTSGRLALLDAQGCLREKGTFRNYGITGEVFEARVISRVTVGEIPAVIPEITGKAYITGRGEMLLEAEDPLKDGLEY